MKYLVALAASAIIAVPVIAAPAPYPKPSSFATGSYTQSCDKPTFSSSNPWIMHAFCNLPKEFMKKQKDEIAVLNYMGCDAGSIGNYNGVLKCNKSDGSLMTHMALKNSQAVRSAAVIVMGTDPEWSVLQKYYAYGWKTNPAFKSDDLDFSTAALTLREYLTKAASMSEIHAVEAAAYKQATGQTWSASQPNSIQVWPYQEAIRSGKLWYAPLVLEMKKPKSAAPTNPNTPPPPPIH